ncbi:MAG TPA: alpha/beta fold hydrolase, partial [Gemmatimonadaceae bacterium]
MHDNKNTRNHRCGFLVWLATMVWAFPLVATAQNSATGRWEGTLRRGASTLSVAVDLPADQPDHGFFTAPDLGAMDVPLTHVRVGREMYWELVGDQSTLVFTGTLSHDVITGSVVEGRTTGTFALHRVSSSTAKPYTSSDVRVDNGGVVLSGTVLSPRAPGRHAAVVFLHGSGAEGRWANGLTADYLARRGVVALIYDKRGVGASTGDWKTSTLDDLAADARAVVHLLSARSDVDPRRVGVYGHSQGGFIAPMVAAGNADVRWIIDADGNAGPQYEQDLFRVGNMLRKQFHGDTLRDALSFYREFVDVARNGLPHDQLDADKAKYRSAAWYDHLGIPDDQDWIWRWYRGVGNTDNRSAWAAIDVPVLLLYGERDETVSPTQSIETITRILKANHDPRVTVRILPDADHTLRVPAMDPLGWPHYA